MSRVLREQILARIIDENDVATAASLFDEILRIGKQIREADKGDGRNDAIEELLRQRENLYQVASSQVDYDDVFVELREISRELRRQKKENEQFVSLETQLKVCAIQDKIEQLRSLVEGRLPWNVTYAAEVDPDIDPKNEAAKVTFTGTIESCDATGREKDAWAESCIACDVDISLSEQRLRCFDCAAVYCTSCHALVNHAKSCSQEMVLLEPTHPTFMRMDIRPSSLASTLRQIFQVWAQRPCFLPHDARRWITYEEVWDRVARYATKLCEMKISELVLCYPPGSVDFYYVDLACAIAGITSHALPVCCKVRPPGNIGYVACDASIRKQVDLDDVEFLEFEEMHGLPRFTPSDSDQPDPPDSLYTTFYTSGSTGLPSPVPVRRREFISEFAMAHVCFPECMFSFQPPCWAPDRLLVYGALYNGYRVAFSRPQPMLHEIVKDLQKVKPTHLVAPPLLLEFMSAMEEPPLLGDRLRTVMTGGAPVSSVVKNWVQETYGVWCWEGYGTTECGGIAVDGSVVPKVQKSLKIRNPETGKWVDTTKNVIGELWVGDFNTKDLVELTNHGTRIRVLGRSGGAEAIKMENGRWCSLLDIEQDILRKCAPDLLSQVLVMQNSKKQLVLLAVTDSDMTEEQFLCKVRERTITSASTHLIFPRSVVMTRHHFPVTMNLKMKRSEVVRLYRNAAEKAPILSDNEEGAEKGKIVKLASLILGHSVDPGISFFENGGDSITAVSWLKELKFLGDNRNWWSKLNDPLEGSNPAKQSGVYESPAWIPKKVEPLARHILLTGATGFLGRHVLRELLEKDKESIVVCLVREESQRKIKASDRILVVAQVPTEFKYRQVFHLAAEVNHLKGFRALKASNIDLTKHLLEMRLAPMVYCSTSNTLQRDPPFRDGYTQTKWASEQMVLRSGGKCVWPPFLLWCNERDWLTRLMRYCISSGMYPNELGFLPCAEVETCAKDIIYGSACTCADLDLRELFALLALEISMRPVSLASLCAQASRDPDCALYPVLPLFQVEYVGQPRSEEFELFRLTRDLIKTLLESLGRMARG